MKRKKNYHTRCDLCVIDLMGPLHNVHFLLSSLQDRSDLSIVLENLYKILTHSVWSYYKEKYSRSFQKGGSIQYLNIVRCPAGSTFNTDR
jgi:hypothetical protein